MPLGKPDVQSDEPPAHHFQTRAVWDCQSGLAVDPMESHPGLNHPWAEDAVPIEGRGFFPDPESSQVTSAITAFVGVHLGVYFLFGRPHETAQFNLLEEGN